MADDKAETLRLIDKIMQRLEELERRTLLGDEVQPSVVSDIVLNVVSSHCGKSNCGRCKS